MKHVKLMKEPKSCLFMSFMLFMVNSFGGGS